MHREYQFQLFISIFNWKNLIEALIFAILVNKVSVKYLCQIGLN